MKRLGWKWLILVPLAAIVFLWIIKTPFISSYLTKKMRVPVSIEYISIWPSSTTIHEFKIKNPKGFKTSIAFKAKTTEIDYKIGELFGNPCVIDQIVMENIFLGVEFSNPLGTSNNWTAISDRMPKQKSDKRVIIHKLILTNLTIEIRGLGLFGKPMTKTIDRLEFYEIDSAQGFPTEELIKQVFGGSGIQQYIKDAFNPAKQIENLLNPFKIFGKEKGPETLGAL